MWNVSEHMVLSFHQLFIFNISGIQLIQKVFIISPLIDALENCGAILLTFELEDDKCSLIEM